MSSVNTIMRGGSRFYVEPETGVKAPGVTSIISMGPKPFLQFWSAKMAAECAVDNIGSLVGLAMNDRQGAIDFVKGAARRYTKQRADVGSEAHDLFERMARGEVVRRVHPDLEPYRAHFAEFLDQAQPEFLRMEDVAWSEKHNYAGSFDAIARIGGEVVMLDYKTSKATYADVSLQATAYAYADVILDADGNRHEMPKCDAGAVLHVTPEQWALKPVEVSDRVFAQFLALRKTFDWDRETSKEVIGKPVMSGGTSLVTGTQRRAK
ncbi:MULTISPECIES: PD-(D/E)XK nuclease family protein [Streptomyces]|uniref:PD-(D/E)XK endonuclease-like domain-containing protein n=2 Tax=Streptomyces TaxID=1883 RepID=A0A1E7LPP9_9ACTN|nr:hypothetical protein [Streptomyces nanshensis]OEV18167.1 hypothetical protein AN221_23795 [Streptomyces nanshensis]